MTQSHDFCLQALMRKLHEQPDLVDATQAIFVNGNSGNGVIPGRILELPTPRRILAASLLFSSAEENSEQFIQFCCSVQCPHKAVELIRTNLSMEESDMLLILVDELGKMCEGVAGEGTRAHLRGQILGGAMELMDQFHPGDPRSIAFIFSALVQNDINKWRGITGRSLFPTDTDAALKLLTWKTTQKTVTSLLQGNETALRLIGQTNGNSKVINVLRQSFGHPRCVVDVAAELVRSLAQTKNTDPTPVDIAQIISNLLTALSVADVDEDIVSKLLSRAERLEPKQRLQLTKTGVLCQHPQGNTILLPMLLSKWAIDNAGNDALTAQQQSLAWHIRNVFSHDNMVGLKREEHAEPLLAHVEAVFRVATGGDQEILLSQLFGGAGVADELKERLFRVGPTKQQVVHNVEGFEDDSGTVNADVLEKLAQGHILWSTSNVVGVDYLSPLWDSENNKMIILGGQVKHRPAGITFETIDIKIRDALWSLFRDDYEFIPLILTTLDPLKTKERSIPANSICFDREGLKNYTQYFGFLNLVDEIKSF